MKIGRNPVYLMKTCQKSDDLIKLWLSGEDLPETLTTPKKRKGRKTSLLTRFCLSEVVHPESLVLVWHVRAEYHQHFGGVGPQESVSDWSAEGSQGRRQRIRTQVHLQVVQPENECYPSDGMGCEGLLIVERIYIQRSTNVSGALRTSSPISLTFCRLRCF